MYRAGKRGKRLFRAGQGMYRAGQGKKIKLLPGDLADPGDLYLKNPHRLTNFEIIDLFKNKPRFNGAYSRNRLQEKIKKEHM